MNCDITIPIPDKKRIKADYNGVPKSSKIKCSQVILKKNLGLVVYFLNKLMVRVDGIPVGVGFGEMALNEENTSGQRMASILAEEDMHCLVLDRKSYQVRNPNMTVFNPK